MSHEITPQPGVPRKLKLVETAPLASQIERVLDHALTRALPDLGPDRRAEIVADARRDLLGVLKHEGRPIRGTPKGQFLRQLEQSRDSVVAERNRALLELEDLRQKTLRYHDDVAKEDENIADREAEAARVHDEGLRRRIKKAFELFAGQTNTPLGPLQNKLIALTLEAGREERDRVYEEFSQMTAEHLRQFELLERRIGKMTKALDHTESELKRLAHLKADDLAELEAGVAAVFQMVQGFYEDDEKADMKADMMKGVFQQNLGIQGTR